TEVGYVGRDVESMIRDLVETSIRLVKDEKYEKVRSQAESVANTKIRDIMYAKAKMTKSEEPENYKDVLLNEIAEHKHDDEMIEMEVVDAPKAIEIIPGNQDSGITEMLSGFMPKRKRIRKISVKQARNIIVEEESSKLIDMDAVQEEGMRRAEQEGIIFIDEIDKIAMSRGNNSGADVSREGVQRDILPFVEGCTVSTKYGIIKTDYILFIAAGAFHVSNIEDLIPELQGRFPVRVELDNLTSKEFYKILSKPKNAITKQQIELLKVDNINLSFDDEALKQIADIAELENESNENIGARRLYTIMEALLEEISFDAGDDHPLVDVKVTKQFVLKVLGSTIKNYDMSKYIM
ncbi:MAG: ATP-dependent protease ATPase subunit HslU, partial [Clostridia bacterium]|nr:ATP-dependent protease ATPase subunit HslU [Clostridia bacterium]